MYGFTIVNQREYPYKLGTYRMYEADIGVGLFHYSFGYDQDKAQIWASIDSVYIRREFRKQGFATKTIQDFIESESNHDIYLFVEPSDDADLDRCQLIDFYKKFGFEEVKDKHDRPFNYTMMRKAE